MSYYKFDKVFETDSDKEITESLSRTIQEVYDEKNGVYIDSDDFFKKTEGELVLWRRALEEAILFDKPRLVCSHCYQMVKLLGRHTYRGKIAFFAHLYDSEDCDIKTIGSSLTREEILARKYGKIQESERHINLKNFIANILSSKQSQQQGFTDIVIEKRISSNIPYLSWRRPDVCANYKGKNIVFELQLSTTFVDIVVDRDIFYRLNNYFIIWVFNFDDNQQYVNLQNLMCKDIYYANKRNVFILDRDAQQKSVEEGVLYLKCRWLTPEGKFTDGKLISFDELSFDTVSYKPYYIDADEIYYSINPKAKNTIIDLELSRKEMLNRLMDKMLKRYQAQLILEEKQKDAIHRMDEANDCAIPYEQDGLYGYEYDSIPLVAPYYTYAEKIDKNGYAKVRKRSYGLVNKYGANIIPCICKEIIPFGDHKFIVQIGTQWKIYGKDESIRKVSSCDKWYFSRLFDRFDIASLKYETKARSGPDPSKEYDLLFYPNGEYVVFRGINTEESHTDKDYVNANIYMANPKSGIIWSKELANCQIDKNGIIHIVINSELKLATTICINSHGKCAIECSDNKNRICEYSYDYLEPTICNVYIAYKGELCGIISETNKVILPVEFSEVLLAEPTEHYFYVRKETIYGLFSIDEGFIIPLQYQSIKYICENCWLVRFDNKYGLVNDFGTSLIACEYDSIQLCSTNPNDLCFYSEDSNIPEYKYWLLSKAANIGVASLDCKLLMDGDYRDILLVDEHLAIVTKKNGFKGVVSMQGKNIARTIYDDISITPNIIICHSYGFIEMIDKEGQYLGKIVCDEVVSQNGIYILVNIANLYLSLFNIYGDLLYPGYTRNLSYKINSTSEIESRLETINDVLDNFEGYETINDLVLTRKDMKYGIFNINKKIIVYPIFNSIQVIQNDIIVAEYFEKRQVQDGYQYEYQYRRRVSYPKYKTVWDRFYLIMNSRGELLSEIKWDKICYEDKENRIALHMQGEIEYMNETGDFIYKREGNIDNETYICQFLGSYGVKNDCRWIIKPHFHLIEFTPDKNILINSGVKSIRNIYDSYDRHIKPEAELLNENYELKIEAYDIKYLADDFYLVTEKEYANYCTYLTSMLCDSTGNTILEKVLTARILSSGDIVVVDKKKLTLFSKDKIVKFEIENATISNDADYVNGKLEILRGDKKAYVDLNYNLIPYDVKKVFNGFTIETTFDKQTLSQNGSLIFSKEFDEIKVIWNSIIAIRENRQVTFFDRNLSKIKVLNNINNIELVEGSENYFLIKKDSKYGVVNRNLSIILPADYDAYKIDEEKSIIILMQLPNIYSKYIYGLSDLNGKIVVQCMYKSISFLNSDIVKAEKSDLKYDYFLLNGTKLDANEITLFDDEKILLCVNNKNLYCLLDSQGNKITSYYNSIKKENEKFIGHNGVAWVDVMTKEVIRYNDNIEITSSIDDTYQIFKCNNKYGIMSKDSKIIRSCCFDKLYTENHIIYGVIKDQTCSINITSLILKPKENDVCVGKIVNIKKYGLFINVKGLNTGLLHISKMKGLSVDNFRFGDFVFVKLLKIHNANRIDYELIIS